MQQHAVQQERAGLDTSSSPGNGEILREATVSANVVLLPLYAAPKDKTLGRETRSVVGRDTEWTRKYKDPTTGDQVGTSP